MIPHIHALSELVKRSPWYTKKKSVQFFAQGIHVNQLFLFLADVFVIVVMLFQRQHIEVLYLLWQRGCIRWESTLETNYKNDTTILTYYVETMYRRNDYIGTKKFVFWEIVWGRVW